MIIGNRIFELKIKFDDAYTAYEWCINNLCTIENMYDRFNEVTIELENLEDFQLAKRLCAIYEYYRMEVKKLDKFGYCDCKEDVYFYASTEGNCLYSWLHKAMESYMYVGEVNIDDDLNYFD